MVTKRVQVDISKEYEKFKHFDKTWSVGMFREWARQKVEQAIYWKFGYDGVKEE